MPEEKKPSPGPIVVRKGHVKPPPPGARIEAPEEEVLAPGPAKVEKEDSRPLWQRLAEEKASVSRAPSGPSTPSTPRPRRGPPLGDVPRDRGGKRDRPPRERDERRAEPRPPPPAPGEPPPAPEVAAPDEGSFADMLAGVSAAPRRRFQVGEKVAGKIIQLGHDIAFLELGSGVAEGMIEVAELKDADGNVAAREGDIVDGVVVQATHRGVVISKGHGRTSRDHGHDALAEAARSGLPVDGIVKAVNKGGLEVEVHGADDRDAVLSRRALLEEERAGKAKLTREKLAPGAIFEGVVTSVQDYGAFVDLGGVEGLVHVSELSWDRVSKPQDLLKSGDAVQVQVLKIEQDPKKGERVSLSVRALTPRPEPTLRQAQGERGGPEAPPRTVPPPPPRAGDVVEAVVDKIESFGVFVRFAGGRGLVPASETGTPRGADLRKAFKPGDTFQALILAIDELHRIRLSKSGAQEAAERKEAAEYMKAAAPKTSGKGFGTLGDLLRAKLDKK